jgi:predicted permease
VLGFADTERMTVNAGGQAGLADSQYVSGDYFSILGVRAALGRTLLPSDDVSGASAAAVISYGYWTRRFGRVPSVVGRSITLNGVSFTVAGVAPPEFFGVQPGTSIDVWIPLHTQPQVDARWADPKEGSKFTAPGDWWVVMMGRLKPGINARQAQAAVDVIVRQNVLALGPQKKRFEGISLDPPRVELAPASKGLDNLRREFSRPLFVLMGVVSLVLLIACANVGNLLLARATVRQKEIAVRLALGAGRRRLIRQLLTESVLLASVGGVLGVFLAYWASGILLAFMSSGSDPIALHVTPNLRVLGFTEGISVLTGILFGLAPALRGTRLSLTPALKQGAGSRAGWHRGHLRPGLGRSLVVSQVAMCLLLLMGAGLFVRTLVNLQHQSLGFDARNLLLFRLDPLQAGYQADKLPGFYQELQRRLAALPGVQSVSVSENTLINGGAWIDGILIQGYTPKPSDGNDGQIVAWLNPVGSGFFATMGIPVVLGRAIDDRDAPSAPKVAVINQTLARQCFGGSSPVGHRLGGFGNSKPSDFQIVGVVGDAKYGALRDKVPPTVFIAYAQNPDPGPTSIEVRTAGDPKQWMSAVRGAVQSLDRNLPLFDFKTQTEQIDQATFQERLFARLSSFFGLLALALACVGLYGMMSYAVARRTNEIGIRMALGAEREGIRRMVLREVMTLAALGIVIGVPAVLAASRLVATMLYGLKPTDPWTIVSATSVLVVVALLAGYLPARRASRVDPMVALRYE